MQNEKISETNKKETKWPEKETKAEMWPKRCGKIQKGNINKSYLKCGKNTKKGNINKSYYLPHHSSDLSLPSPPP